MQFTWFATAWDNDDLVHRLGMLTAMLIVIVLAAGIPRVYEGNDRLFVFAYAGDAGGPGVDVREGAAARG